MNLFKRNTIQTLSLKVGLRAVRRCYNFKKGMKTMLKVFRFLLISTLAMAFLSGLAWAQKGAGERTVWDTYYSLTDPGNTPLGDPPWVGPSPAGLPVVLGDSDMIWIGTENLQVDEWKKEWWIELEGDNVFINLESVDVVAYDSSGSSAGYQYSPIAKTQLLPDIEARFNVKIWPQPHWEVMQLHATGDVTIDDIKGYSECGPGFMVPALTEWGMIVLLVLLVISGIIVIRQRRAAARA
jgi:hypothetical protein